MESDYLILYLTSTRSTLRFLFPFRVLCISVTPPLTMPTLSSLTRSLTLPLNRKRTKPQSPSTVVTPSDERPGFDLDPPASILDLTTSDATPPPPVSTPPRPNLSARRQTSFLGIKTPPISTNGGIFNLNLDGLLSKSPSSPPQLTPTSPTTDYVIPAYIAPDSLSNTQGVVFGKPLKESLKYASVQISTANADGVLYVWGYIPVVVAKWCVLSPRFFPPTPSPFAPVRGSDLFTLSHLGPCR